MRSVMNHNFSQVPRVDIPRSVFDRSHGYKTTLDASYLVPILVDEILPGDSITCHPSLFARLATPKTPFMDNLFLDTFFFFVPNRLVWEHWEEFNGQQASPNDTTDYLIPQLPAPTGGWDVGTLADYFGLPTYVDGYSVNAMPFRAYNLIYNEWFRHQDLQDSLAVATGDGPDDNSYYSLKKRTKRHDYFTSCLPFPQKGEDVLLPLGATAPVFGNGRTLGLQGYSTSGTMSMFGLAAVEEPSQLSAATGHALKDVGEETTYLNRGLYPSVYKALGVASKEFLGIGDTDPQNLAQNTGLYADLESATAASINDIREAFQLQRLFERDARGGTRYTEIIRSHFGVVSPDARLQRPEYLGGGSTRININPVAQTSTTDPNAEDTTPQGNLAAFGVGSLQGGGFTKSFTEHGFIIGLANVRADITYQTGIARMWSRQTRIEHYLPVLAHLGEQEVLMKEIWAEGTAQDDIVFGYQERWAEYRYKPSLITGQFRSSYPQTLDYWHLSEDIGSMPSLNSDFIEDKTDASLDRVSAVTSEPHLLMDVWFDYKAARPMPTYSVPGMIDHF